MPGVTQKLYKTTTCVSSNHTQYQNDPVEIQYVWRNSTWTEGNNEAKAERSWTRTGTGINVDIKTSRSINYSRHKCHKPMLPWCKCPWKPPGHTHKHVVLPFARDQNLQCHDTLYCRSTNDMYKLYSITYHICTNTAFHFLLFNSTPAVTFW